MADDFQRPQGGPPSRRRAGLRPDERDPDEPQGEPGSAGGGVNMSGVPGGGLASGGMAGTNAPSGSTEGLTDQLADAFGDGTFDTSGPEEVGGGPPYSGPSGGAVGGTPAERHAEGGETGGGIAPNADVGDDRTIGTDPYLRKTSVDQGDIKIEEDKVCG